MSQILKRSLVTKCLPKVHQNQNHKLPTEKVLLLIHFSSQNCTESARYLSISRVHFYLLWLFCFCFVFIMYIDKYGSACAQDPNVMFCTNTHLFFHTLSVLHCLSLWLFSPQDSNITYGMRAFFKNIWWIVYHKHWHLAGFADFFWHSG